MLALFLKNVWNTLNVLKTFRFLKTISKLCQNIFDTPLQSQFLNPKP